MSVIQTFIHAGVNVVYACALDVAIKLIMDAFNMYEVLYRTKFVPHKIKLDVRAPCLLIKCNTLLAFVLINLYRQTAGSSERVAVRYLRRSREIPVCRSWL